MDLSVFNLLPIVERKDSVDSIMPVINKVRIIRFYSNDNSSCAEFDYFMTRKPNGNLQIFFDDELIIDITDRDHADYDDIEFR